MCQPLHVSKVAHICKLACHSGMAPDDGKNSLVYPTWLILGIAVPSDPTAGDAMLHNHMTGESVLVPGARTLCWNHDGEAVLKFTNGSEVSVDSVFRWELKISDDGELFREETDGDNKQTNAPNRKASPY